MNLLMVKNYDKNRRQRRTIGAFIKVPLDKEFHTYGRILENANFAFYDIRTKEGITDLHKIASSPILFIVGVCNHAVTKGRWRKVGKLPLDGKLLTLPPAFIQDIHDPKKFSIYDPNSGKITLSTREECEGFERSAVWEPEHAESRIRDHYAGVSNIHVEHLKIRN